MQSEKPILQELRASPGGSGAPAPTEIGAEAKITSHQVLQAFDPEAKGFELLLQDLFDTDKRVVLSALATMSRLRRSGSLKLIVRLLKQPDESIRCAAVRALASIGHPLAVKTFFDLYKLSKSDTVRSAILEALTEIAPTNPEVLKLLRETALSPFASAGCRISAVTGLIMFQNDVDVAQLLVGTKEEVMEAVYRCAAKNEQVRAQAILHGAATYQRLPRQNRLSLVELISPFSLPGSMPILLEALEDPDSQVRSSAYSILGQSRQQLDHFPQIIERLNSSVDPDPTMEEEALAAIRRMEQSPAGTLDLSPGNKAKIFGQIQQLFSHLSASERKMTSESHELGWLISRSREYMEYYGSERFRQAVLSYLKGGNYYTKDRLLVELKSSAVKVEVGHFEGYRALAEIIEKPKRPGIALIARELAIVKLDKRKLFYLLIRALWLTRLVDLTDRRADASNLFLHIYTWAKTARQYRLAEAALFALAGVDIGKARSTCQECLALPISSKILAIAWIRLLGELEWSEAENLAVKLLLGTDDKHILLNLIDALVHLNMPVGAEAIKALVRILCSSQDREIAQRVAHLLGCQSTFNVFDSITEHFERGEDWRCRLFLSVLERKVLANQVANREGMIEFLYGILRTEGNPSQAMAAVLLWRLGDDYALKVLKDFFLHDTIERRVEILKSLKGTIDCEIVAILVPLLKLEDPSLQEALRDTLLSTGEPSAQRRIRDMVLDLRGAGSLDSDMVQESGEAEVQVDFLQEKKAYRFEREFVQDLAVLFSDIEGYSQKAQALSSMQLTALIQEYEGILLPTVHSHHGELIKRMGDGHLFVFQSPLDSVLAAVRLQKALKRFNSYREENERVSIRIGIHWGKVVRKEGDILGNHVNIASRLEGSARGGSTLISEALFQRLDGHIHAREIGLIKVKGIAEPIKAYEPYEIVVDLPAALDPLKRKPEIPNALAAGELGARWIEPAAGGVAQNRLVMDSRTARYLFEVLTDLVNLCREVEAGHPGVERIREEVTRLWKELRTNLPQREQA